MTLHTATAALLAVAAVAALVALRLAAEACRYDPLWAAPAAYYAAVAVTCTFLACDIAGRET